MDDRLLIAEGLSRSLLDETGLGDPQVDIFALAAHLELAAIPARTSALHGRTLATR